MMQLDFRGRVALVTGATRGIGKQVADDLARFGAKVIGTGTNAEAIAGLNRDAMNGDAPRQWLQVDFASEKSTDDFIAALDRFPKIDVVVNNAGINRIRPISETRLEDWQELQRVNLEGPMRIVTHVSAGMAERKYGRIVTLSSIFGTISKPQRALYSMSKFGVRGLTIAAALELASSNVLINTVSPGFVRTELTERILSAADQQALKQQVPAGRFAEPDEISRVITFLVSDANTYLTAQNVVVDGGFTNS
jgi:NAD(P)-dependent dehydrogenase (short-subunit alcohol dehydrogenase family)